MAAKFRNKIRQVLYRPIKKRPQLEFVTKRLADAEKVLDLTVGGTLRKRRRRKRGKKQEK
ncbi:MAG: hypothetical protein LBE55_00080 [Clostridiales bacterium]|jgi:hypothetical protein|nr:hypothetical protein [Clostridiales bacterium]